MTGMSVAQLIALGGLSAIAFQEVSGHLIDPGQLIGPFSGAYRNQRPGSRDAGV